MNCKHDEYFKSHQKETRDKIQCFICFTRLTVYPSYTLLATHPLLSAKKNQSEVNIFISNFLISSILLWWLDTQVAMATLSFLIFLKFLGEDRPPISFPCRNLSDPVPMATQRCWQCRKRESNTLWWWCIKQGHRHNLSSSSCFTYFMS